MSTGEVAPKLVELGQGIFSLSAAKETEARSQSNDGIDSIVLLGWLEAATKHVLKYAPHYQRRYPHAQIIFIACKAADWMYISTEAQIARALPAVKALVANEHSSGSSSWQKDKSIVVHAFSNGGSLSLCNLARAYQRETGSSLPLRGVIFDSAPGRLRYGPAMSTIATLMPKSRLIRFIARLVASFIFAFTMLLWKFGWRDQIEGLRNSLNKGMLARAFKNRLYIYSRKDEQVLCQDVEDHAREAEALGAVVRTKAFHASPHVGHLVSSPEEYWRSVDDFLTEISQKQN